MRRIAPTLTSLLLVASAVLVVGGAWQRWAAVCPVGGDWETRACLLRQNHEAGSVLPSAPWEGVHSSALLLGLGYVVLACALLLLPAAFAMQARPWQVAAVAVTTSSVLVVGSATALSGLQGQIVEFPALRYFVFLWVFALPAALFLLIWRPHADSPRLGARRVLVVSLLVFTTPLLHYLFVSRILIPYASHDTSPWSEAAIAPLLLAAAVALGPWRVATTQGVATRP